MKLFSLPPFPIPPDIILLRLSNKNFLRKIYINIQTFVFKVLQKCCSWLSGKVCSANVFSDTKQKIVCWKICKVWKVFWLCFGTILFSMSRELRFLKLGRFFERNYVVKWVIFFTSFYWLWDSLLENLQ